MRPPFAFRGAVNSGNSTPGASQRDLRRRMSRQAWLANRARNALRRPVFIGAISAGTFVIALASLIVVPRATRQRPAAIPVMPRPDTVGPLGSMALGRLRIAEADSMLAAARDSLAARAAAQAALLQSDTVAQQLAVRDSLRARVDQLDALLGRAEQAPLPSSYRAIAAAPEFREDSRMRALVDSLDGVEREREGFGAVGGVDPTFVALTARANEIGRAIQSLASARRAQMAAAAGPEVATAAMTVQEPAIDTMEFITAKDSISRAIAMNQEELQRRRAVVQEIDLQEERARDRANQVAPPLAMLTAAFVLAAVMGFGVALFGELRRPRVSDANELERFLGNRVLAEVEMPLSLAERGRREADRAAPPYLHPGAEPYQLAYLGLATGHPSLLMTTVTGDADGVAAVVAANLAGVAAGEARNTLVLDLTPSSSGSAALRVRPVPGIADVIRGAGTWPDVTVSARVGRDRSLDVVPWGSRQAPDAGEVLALLKRDSARLARYYDAVFVAAAPELVIAGLPEALPSPDVIFCVQPGITPLRWLKARLEEMEQAGAVVRGVVLWSADRPLLPAARDWERTAKRAAPDTESVPVGA